MSQKKYCKLIYVRQPALILLNDIHVGLTTHTMNPLGEVYAYSMRYFSIYFMAYPTHSLHGGSVHVGLYADIDHSYNYLIFSFIFHKTGLIRLIAEYPTS